MYWFTVGAIGLNIILLLTVAITDIAARSISNAACLTLALLAVLRLPPTNLTYLLPLMVSTVLLSLLLLTLYARGYVGGGDVKLLAALAIGLPLGQLLQLLTVTALAGGVLALIHLMMRLLPMPARPPVGSSRLRRVYAVERWRHLRRAPLPYGVAIACGGIWSVLTYGV